MTGAALVLGLMLFQQSPPDTEQARESARRAEAAYERAARRFAPFVGWRSGSTECDEIVGRFCLRFDDDPSEPPPEPARITDARRAAIDSLRRAFTVLPGDLAVSGALVRLLVEDGRAAEAASAALTFGALTRDSVMGPLLEGFALHTSGADSLAAVRFAAALARMDPEDVERAQALEWLLARAERGRYRDLAPPARQRYEHTVWRLADPLYLTSGNERWSEHLARYTYARLLERAPVVRDMNRWGRDLEELTVRYGVPQRRGRQNGTRIDESGIVEYYDPDQLAFVIPDLLTNGVPPQPPPGTAWPLDEARARSGYAPNALRSLEELPHQVSRIPMRDGWVLRFDGLFELDSLARVPPDPLPGDTARPPAPEPAGVQAGLWLLDPAQAATDVAHRRSLFPLASDTARITLAVRVTPGEYVYSFEGLEPATRTARRARYALTLADSSRLRVSDVIIAQPFDGALPLSHGDSALQPRTRLVLRSDERVGVFVETADPGPGTYAVDVSIRPADRASLPRRLVRWLGRTLGVASAPAPARVRWLAQHTGDAPLIVAVDLGLADVDKGLQRIVVRIEDLHNDERAEASRLVRIEQADPSGR